MLSMNNFWFFYSFCKIIAYMLFTWRHYIQSEIGDQQVKSKQCYVPKYNLETKEGNVNLHTKVVNVANIIVGNDSKPSSLGANVVAPNNNYDKEDSLKRMSSLIDDS